MTANASKTPRATAAHRPGILCGTDFSPEAQHATEAAAAIARKLGEPLVLAHAIEIPHLRTTRAEFLKWMTASRRREMRKQADDLRKSGVEVEMRIPAGRADEMLCELAQNDAPRLIVLASQRRRGAVDRWLLGSVIERTAQRALTPTLVVRDAATLEAWARGVRPLKVFVCFNFTATSQAALRWVKNLRAIGPCEVVVGYANWPFEDFVRLGGASQLPFDGNPPDVQSVLERDVRARASEVLGKTPFHLRVEANWGRPDIRLAEMAKEEAADLLVVGSHQYDGFERFWHMSVSRGLLHEAPMNVAIVPLATDKAAGPGIAPPVRRVLVSTDFSEMANIAIPHAYSILRAGGTVHLLHVVASPIKTLDRGPSIRSSNKLKHAAKLRALIPENAAAQGISTQVEVIESRDVAEAICQTAERLGVDVVCLATHGRSGLSKAVLGSVAQTVMTRSRRPLFVVHSQPK
jgi:nucleotide-binding universal stress UspA family protein